MSRMALPLVSILFLTACGGLPPLGRDRAADAPNVTVTEDPGDEVTRPRARRGDTPQDEEPPQPDAGGYLGETLAGLGSPGEAGLWLRTGLVASTQQGRVETETGTALTLELRPSGTDPSAGSQLSLAAMQQLGLPLNQLASLRVFVEQ